MSSRLNARVSGLEEQRNSQMQCLEISPEEVARRLIFRLERIKRGHTKDDNLLKSLRRNPSLREWVDQFMSEA